MSVLAAKQAAWPSHTDISFLKNTLLHKCAIHIALDISLNTGRKITNTSDHHSSALSCFLYVKKGSLFSDFTSEDIKLWAIAALTQL